MTYIQSFDSIEDMYAAMAEAENAANERITKAQSVLRDTLGDGYWVRVWEGVVIYGECEAADTENRRRGYLTGMAYSVMEPHGEYGDTHVSEVIPISRDVFDMARRLDWPTVEQMVGNPLMSGLFEALSKAELHNRKND